ncbi:hypothetical protein JW949_02565 [Candidatus Woesearchaeota archaeon]|nr:hypothetical protein [Candidatus Woesearchaeota archaeon]
MIKKRVLLFIYILFLFFSVIVVNADTTTKIHDGWHLSGESFQVDDTIHTVTGWVSESTDSEYNYTDIRINMENKTTPFIEKYSCYSEALYKYCFDNLSWYEHGSRINPVTNKWEPAIRVIIYELKPNIKITREIEKAKLNNEEKTKVTITLENTGEKDASDLIYREEIPTDIFTFKSSSEGSLKGRIIEASFDDLKKDNTKSFYYSIEAKDYGKAKLKGNITYKYEGIKKELSSKAQDIEVVSPYKLEIKATPSKTNIDKLITYSFELENKDPSEDLNFSLEVYLPDYFNVKSKATSLEYLSSKHLYHSSKIKSGQKTTLEINGQVPYTGDYIIESFVDMNIFDEEMKEEVNKTIIITTNDITPKIDLYKKTLKSNDKMNLYFSISNKDTANTYYDINYNIYSDFFDEGYSLDYLLPGKEQVEHIEITAPEVSEEIVYVIKLEGDYRTKNNEDKTFYTEKKITVKPLNKSFSIKQEISRKTVPTGGTIIIQATIENLLDTNLNNVKVRDEFDSSVVLVQGSYENTLNLGKKEKQDAYLYKIKVPENFTKRAFNITTILDYEASGKVYVLTRSTEIKVTNVTDVQDEGQGKEDKDSSSGKEGDSINEGNKKGFIAEVISAIVDFFGNLFS